MARLNTDVKNNGRRNNNSSTRNDNNDKATKDYSDFVPDLSIQNRGRLSSSSSSSSSSPQKRTTVSTRINNTSNSPVKTSRPAPTPRSTMTELLQARRTGVGGASSSRGIAPMEEEIDEDLEVVEVLAEGQNRRIKKGAQKEKDKDGATATLPGLKRRTVRRLGPAKPSVFGTGFMTGGMMMTTEEEKDIDENGIGIGNGIADDESTTPDAQASYNASQMSSRSNEQGRRPLQIAHVNSMLLPLSKVTLETGDRSPAKEREMSRLRRRVDIDRGLHSRGHGSKVSIGDDEDEEDDDDDWLGEDENEEEDDDESTDLSGFIVSDGSVDEGESESEEEVRRQRKKTPAKKGTTRSPVKGKKRNDLSRNAKEMQNLKDRLEVLKLDNSGDVVDLNPPTKTLPAQDKENRASIRTNTVDSDPLITNDLSDPFSYPILSPFKQIQHSPPRLDSTKTGSITPPNNSPSKPKLQSPSKSKSRIPSSPHRPSIDAFWSQEVINDWNDQYSPTKTPVGRGVYRFLLDKPSSSSESSTFDEFNLPTTIMSPRKPSATPTKGSSSTKTTQKQMKRTKRVLTEKEKDFHNKKHELAKSFVKELDDKIADGQVAKLCASTGGVKVSWSKTLQSTAGRARTGREVIRSKSPSVDDNIPIDPALLPSSSAIQPATGPAVQVRHHAYIELATKVIDDEYRLFNTVAHEFCHVANHIVSGVDDRPHGASFKEWGAKATRAFGDRGVHVRTTHNYKISYKYLWCCVDCGIQYQRHSRSINPTKQVCGKCKGRLEQVRPKPRKGNGIGTGGDNKKTTAAAAAAATTTTGPGGKNEVKVKVEIVDLVDDE